jgi:hypothetical protein
MVYMNLKGGLGNIMFQIFAVHAFALRLGVKCSFPNFKNHLSYLDSDKVYNPQLSHSKEYEQFLPRVLRQAPKQRLPNILYPFEYKELSMPKDCIIDGFFQSEKYFIDIADKIRLFYKLKRENCLEIKKYLEIIDHETAFLHIRRGDYIRLSEHHLNLPVDYYYEGMEILGKERLYLIFSDDIPWCKSTFHLKNSIFVANLKDYEEMLLMSLCGHAVIANSSFSWWGAWLGPQKKIIYPKTWFGKRISYDTKDICPDRWQGLKINQLYP